MKYLLLIYVTEFSSKPGEENEFSGPWRDYQQALKDAPGVFVSGQGLQPPATARTVWLENGKRRVHDGPFAETKEQLGGYILLELASQEEALEWAARCPGAAYGRIEVRPVIEDPIPAARGNAPARASSGKITDSRTEKGDTMFKDADVSTMLPVKDLTAAKKFYEGKLGLKSVHEEPEGAVTYQSGSGKVTVYVSQYAGTNKGTAAAFDVKDVESTAKELKDKGITFERYDNLPGVTRKGDIHIAGDTKLAWFKDPDGNILSIGNMA
jgi:catechol 2,3-dioxygenase-like lactoylglutathione lyase family enzyme